MMLQISNKHISHIDFNFYHDEMQNLSDNEEGQTARVVNLQDHTRPPTVHSFVIVTPDI